MIHAIKSEIRCLERAVAVRAVPYAPTSALGRRATGAMREYLTRYFYRLGRDLWSAEMAGHLSAQVAAISVDPKRLTRERMRAVEQQVKSLLTPTMKRHANGLREAILGPFVFSYYGAALRSGQALARVREARTDPLEGLRSTDPRVLAWINAQAAPVEKVVAWADDHAGRMIRGIDETTKNQVARIVSGQLAAGGSIDQIADAIQDAMPEMARWRSELIANMETSTALNTGAEAKARVDGAEYEAWTTMGVAEDCIDGAPCYANEAEGWIPLGSGYASGYNSCPAHFNCQCTKVFKGGEAALMPETADDAGITPAILDQALGAIVGYLSDVTYKSGLWLPGEELAA